MCSSDLAKRPIKLDAEPAALAKLAKSKDAAMLKALAWRDRKSVV